MRIIDSTWKLLVYTQDTSEQPGQFLGQTPTPAGKGVAVPEGDAWLVEPVEEALADQGLAELACELKAHGIPGLSLWGFRDITNEGLAPLAIPGLRILDLRAA